MSLKDTGELKSNFSKVVSGTAGIARGLVAAYLVAIPVHDIWTGESLISKTWNSTVVAALEDTEMCSRGSIADGSFICEKRGDGKGLGTLVPKF